MLQHKAELGVKHVTEVTIFRDNLPSEFPEVQLLFKIADVVDPQDTLEPEEGVQVRSVVMEARNEMHNNTRVHVMSADALFIRNEVEVW